MRTSILIVVFTIFFISCGDKQKKKKNSDFTASTEEFKNCKKKKFRLCKEKNYFKISEKHIKLNIPVTDNKIKYIESRKIPSNDINAIVVHFLGGPECTPDKGKLYEKNIKPIKFSDIGIERDQLKDSLLVVIFVNDSLLTTKDVKGFQEIIAGSSTYQQALEGIQAGNICNSILAQPREQDGDVIGGI